MKRILYKIFGKPTYFYNPMLGRGEGGYGVAMYSVDIYKHWMGKSTLIRCYADTNPIRVLSAVHSFMEYVNNNEI